MFERAREHLKIKKIKKLYCINREGNKLKEQFLLIGEGQC